MPTSLNDAVSDLPTAVGAALEEFVEAARAAFGASLRSVVLYGSAAEGRLRPTSDVNVILVLDAFDRAAADRLRGPLGTARAAIDLAVMFLLAGEVRPASEAFANKFADVLRRRRVLFGEDPFRGLSIPRPAEIARLKQILLNLALRLRASYATSGDREELLARIVADTAGPLRAGAATLRELQGRPAPTGKKALEDLTAELSDARLEEAVARVSEARRTGTLPPGKAGDTLLALARAGAANARAGRGATVGGPPMNPFALYGPEFIVFYTVYGMLVVGLLYAFRHSGEPDVDAGTVNLSDPNLIAYLRGGKNEALRVTTVFLIDRGLLTVQGDRLETRNAEDVARTGNEIEKAILHRLRERSEARSLFADDLCERAADRLRVALERLGLLAERCGQGGPERAPPSRRGGPVARGAHQDRRRPEARPADRFPGGPWPSS